MYSQVSSVKIIPLFLHLLEFLAKNNKGYDPFNQVRKGIYNRSLSPIIPLLSLVEHDQEILSKTRSGFR